MRDILDIQAKKRALGRVDEMLECHGKKALTHTEFIGAYVILYACAGIFLLVSSFLDSLEVLPLLFGGHPFWVDFLAAVVVLGGCGFVTWLLFQEGNPSWPDLMIEEVANYAPEDHQAYCQMIDHLYQHGFDERVLREWLESERERVDATRDSLGQQDVVDAPVELSEDAQKTLSDLAQGCRTT